MTEQVTARSPWDPMPGEPGTSFAGYVVYREFPAQERSLKTVAGRLGRSLSLVERYSARWNWVARTRAWEADQARARSDLALQVEADWVRRHADTGRRLQSLGLAGLGQLLDRDADGQRSGWGRLKPADLVRMIAVGSSLEVTAATNSAGNIEESFVHRVIETVSTVFMEANEHDDPEARAQAFAAGCTRALRDLLA